MTRQTGRVISTSVLLCLSCIAADAAQEPPPFRSGVAAVELQATVIDAGGRPVVGLTRGDFLLEVDGRPRPIDVFQAIHLPMPAQAPRTGPGDLPSDVAINTGADEGRVLLIVVDDLQLAPTHGPVARRLTCAFVERYMAPGDQYSIVATSGRTDLLQDFTNDKGRVLRACGAITGRKNMTAASSPQERLFEFRTSLSVLTGMARRLADLRGRRLSMLVVSSLNVSNSPTTPDSVDYLHAIDESIKAIRQSNVTVYSLDPQGLFLPASYQPSWTSISQGAVSTYGGAPALGRISSDRAQGLRLLAEETGGFAAVDTNEFDRAFARLVEDNSTYYVLGFRADGQSEPERLRNVRVRVNRLGVRVTARRTYIPPTSRLQTVTGWPPKGVPVPLAELLSSPVARSGIRMAAQAIPYGGPSGSSVRLVLDIDGGNGAALDEDAVEIAIVTIDERGRYGDGTTATIQRRAAGTETTGARSSGLRWQADLALEPGTYQIRVAARAVGTRREGLVLLDTVVPQREKQEPTLSAVALASTRTAAAVSAGPDLPFGDLPAPPTTQRTFARGDVLTAAAQACPPRKRPEPPQHLVASLTRAADDKAVAWRATRDVNADAAAPCGSATFTIPTGSLEPGRYVLRMGVPGQEATRVVPIAIVAR